MKVFLLVVVLALLLIWLALRRRNGRPEPVSNRPALPSTGPDAKHHAVSIRFEKWACRAAKEYAGRRLLAAEAPKLPLPDCDAAACRCRFVHYQDRRSGRDRRSPFGSDAAAAASGRFEQERREGRDRRKDPGRS